MRKGKGFCEKRKKERGNGLIVLLVSGADVLRYSVNLSPEGLLSRWWERRLG